MELLVVIAIVGLMVGLVAPALSRARDAARVCQCLCQMRSLGQFTIAYADDHDDHMPRSQHSAAGFGAMPWGYSYFEAIAGHPYTPGDPGWSAVFNGAYRCPLDRRSDRWSYGYNVYFELDANETDGSSWRRLSAIPRPAATVVFTELSDLTSADHAMAHFWVQFDAPPEVDPNRHRPGTGVVFADGHAQTRDFKTLFDFNSEVDCFDPQTAR